MVPSFYFSSRTWYIHFIKLVKWKISNIVFLLRLIKLGGRGLVYASLKRVPVFRFLLPHRITFFQTAVTSYNVNRSRWLKNRLFPPILSPKRWYPYTRGRRPLPHPHSCKTQGDPTPPNCIFRPIFFFHGVTQTRPLARFLRWLNHSNRRFYGRLQGRIRTRPRRSLHGRSTPRLRRTRRCYKNSLKPFCL